MAVSITIIVLVCVFLGIYVGSIIKDRNEKARKEKERIVRIKRHDRRIELKERRWNRKNAIWSVIRYAIITNDLINNSDNFYDYRNNYGEFVYIVNYMKDYEFNQDIYDTAFRVCDRHFKSGDCDHKLTEEDKRAIINRDDYKIDHESRLKALFMSLKADWEDEINSCRKKSDVEERCRYRIDFMDGFMKNEYLNVYESLMKDIDEYRQELIRRIS